MGEHSDAATSIFLPDTVLSLIFQFVDLPDISSVARTCKQWKRSLDAAQEVVFESLAKFYDPRLVELMELLISPQSWKLMLQRRLACNPSGMNQQLQKDLETVFRHEGILPFTNCCHYGCSGVNWYPFEPIKTGGIYFIRFSLNGMNYEPDFIPKCRPPHYDTYEYLDEHWEQQRELLKRWCAVMGLKEEEYDIEKPQDVRRCVMIHFHKDLNLEKYTFSEEEGDEEDIDDEDDDEGEDQDDEDQDDEDGRGRKSGRRRRKRWRRVSGGRWEQGVGLAGRMMSGDIIATKIRLR